MKTFLNLSHAVGFISEALEEDDWKSLADACRAELPAAWVRLQETHRTTPLPELYADREFPKNSTEFKLGGHDTELGHIHIDFVKESNGWEIKQIWMCR
jgi:hypothetical protein